MNKRTFRIVIIVAVVLAPLLAAFIWMRSRPQDRPWIDIPAVNSRGFIGAQMETDAGAVLVSIAPDGTIRQPKGGSSPNDGDFTWHPEGRRIMFVSNRSEDGSEQLFSWRPDQNADALQETPAGAVRSAPWYFAPGNFLLFCSRSDVWSLTWPDRKLRAVMPPAGKQMMVGGEEGGIVEERGNVTEADQWISGGWASLSSALESEGFESARVFGDGSYFAGIARTPRGHALVLANRKPTEQSDAMPIAPEGAEKLELTVSPTQPFAVVSVLDFRYPIPAQVPEGKRKPDGTLTRDYANALVVYDLANGQKIVPFFIDTPQISLMQPALSPNSREIAVCVNVMENNVWVSKALIVVPIENLAFNNGNVSTIVEGDVYDPSWSSDGTQLTYIKGGDVFTINRDGTGEKNLTNGKGRFRKPLFSPQK